MHNPVNRRGTVDSASAVRHTVKLIRNSQEYSDLPSPLQGFIDAQLFGPDRINRQTPSSALPARLLSAQVFQSVAQLHFNDLLGRNPDPYLGTFSFRNGEVGMGQPLRYVQTTISKAKAALQHFGLEGVIVPDIDILLPSREEDPIFAFHLHAVVVSASVGKLRLRRTAEKMSDLIGWDSRLPKPVALRGKRPGDVRIHAENISTYTAKFTAAPKLPSLQNGKGKWERDRSTHSAVLAICALYAWSQIPLLKSIHPVGRFGESFHSCWLRKMRRARNVGLGSPSYAPDHFSANWREILHRIGQFSRAH